MSVLAQDTQLGRLDLVEVFEAFDGPRLLSCRNAAGQLFLAVCVKAGPESDTWLYAPISKARHDQVRSGGVMLREAFADPEDGFVHLIDVPVAGGAARVTTLKARSIEPTWLPEHGEALALITATLPSKDVSDLALEATQSRRELITLSLQFPRALRSEAPVPALAAILHAFQRAVDAVGEALFSALPSPPRVTAEARRRTALAVVGTFSGSFTVELASAADITVFGDSLIADSLEALVDLMESSRNPEEFKNKLRRLRAKSAVKYRELLEALIAHGTGVHINWASPRRGLGNHAEMSIQMARVASAVMSQVETQISNDYTVTGQLIGINVRTRRYELFDESEGRKFSGAILDEAMADAAHATVSEFYHATIRELIEVIQATDERKIRHSLVSLRRTDESS